ncbi:GntR family transcriptional regulator [Kineosporia rhizophila]|uniref:GntR family transcriptional regulator n=1 Tax=Kineosporia TaxID=49184 RepID=UPI000A3E29C5|nr:MULTISPECIES: GntR family transcriptional regulator [Kineosporia]MCE0537277.1 GntR family transcriptional regulator [Kineosporia rhizophila]GLY17580.1 GntR family transcriptional regulator [Kineosporia sp. NBRC 101677]
MGHGRRSVLLAQLEPRRTGSPQLAILDELRRVILEGGAPPGTPIPLAEVAALFGVSPIPVREALKTLVGENLVAHRPNAGYVVAQLTRRELSEIYLVRGVLESAALRAAVEMATSADIAAAAQAHAMLETLQTDWDPRSYHRASRHFHLALIVPCRMHRLQRMFESAWNVTEPFQPMRWLPGAERALLHGEHTAMLTAFTTRDAEALLRIAGQHHDRLAQVIASLPERAGLLADPEDI